MAPMTELSKRMLKMAFQMKSTAQAIALLREHADFRTFKSILLNADPEQLPEKELRAKIVAGMCLNHPDKQPDSIKRTVSNWFADRIRTIGRDTAFELCLILKLPLEDANRLMMQITGEAIHWRNPEEIVWGYAISHQLGYEETRGLLNTAALLFNRSSGDHGPDVFTHMVRAEVLEHLAGTPDDLLAYIAGNNGASYDNRLPAYCSSHSCSLFLFLLFGNLVWALKS